MKKEAAELLSEYGGYLHEDYSGKDMYGETTTGIEYTTEGGFFIALASILKDSVQDQNIDNAQLLYDALWKLQIDNIGKDIIYY